MGGLDLLKRRIGKGSKHSRFTRLEPSCLVRLQHHIQSPLNQLIVSVTCEGFMILAVPSVPFYRRVSSGESKMVKDAEGLSVKTPITAFRVRCIRPLSTSPSAGADQIVQRPERVSSVGVRRSCQCTS
jgi:hypothetical protein